jgi:uncharacterized protein YutE (UPF0331/DUF86 family)
MSRRDLDAALVRRHLTALRQAGAHLRHFVGRSQAELRGDLDARWAIERGLQICAQNALDVAEHVAATGGARAPDAEAAIDRLAALAVLPAGFAARFRAVAGMRDVLAHAHLEFDLKFLHAMLNERLGEFAEFGQRVEAWVAERESA